MKKLAIFTFCICVLTVFIACTLKTTADNHGKKVEQTSDFEKNWHHWRGPHANGTAANANPPTTWSEDQNIRWKVPIPGLGHATPIIWEDKIFIQTAIELEMPKKETTNVEEQPEEESGRRRGRRGRSRTIPNYKFEILALNRTDGSPLWQKTLRETVPHEGMHNDSSFASNSPVTDGEHIYAYFGSRGLYCLDMKGDIIWEKDLGKMRKAGTFGEGSCPIIHDNAIIILQDHEDQSFITALDKRTGDEIWKELRDERTTWTSPIVVDYNGTSQVIVPATNRTRTPCYDLANGEVIWECGGMTRNVIPSPLYMDGHVYIISGFRGSSLQAINLELAKGDITDTEAVVWEYNRDTPYVPSPLLNQDIIYFLKGNTGILTAIDRRTGEVNYGPERLNGISSVYASIAGTEDRVYVASRNGNVTVLKYGPTLEVLAQNKLDDSFNASPVIVGSELYLRGTQHLYCIAE